VAPASACGGGVRGEPDPPKWRSTMPPAMWSAIAAIVNRFGYQISLMDEFGLATSSTLMFVTGFICRLRATTLVGGSLLAVHLAMLLIFAGMRAQLAVGVYLSIGGGAIFAVGVLLSIYRDRLLALPQRIKHHEGVFSVLAWR